jgi:outer membrane protein OmpA-like peptidoglycan-associated protein
MVGSEDSNAQSNTGLGIHLGAYDFYGPQTKDYFTSDRRDYNYNTESNTYDTTVKKRFMWNPLVKFTYWRELNRHIGINFGLSLASLEYPEDKPDSGYINRNRFNSSGDRIERFLGEFDVRINYSILPRQEYIVSPYLFAGVNASYHNIYFGADIPLGAGVNIGLNKSRDLSLNIESAYKIAATEHNQNHLQHSIGFVYWFKPGYKVPKAEPVADVPPPPQILDTDNDGINNDVDQCPTIAGTQQFNGCPDSDADGISDKDDACPLVAGIAQFNGCPDTDGDGINDKEDQCPYVAGIAARQGCPVPDKDNDGFNDDEDRCPEVYSKTNGGCPEIRQEIIRQVEKAAKAIFFETGKATIRKTSFKSLDAVIRILKSDATLFADIEGHTDDVGDDESNMTLSQNRAAAVRDYFVSKGVDSSRLTSQGFGETQPVADNSTAAGKAQNRRTVIKLRNFAR